MRWSGEEAGLQFFSLQFLLLTQIHPIKIVDFCLCWGVITYFVVKPIFPCRLSKSCFFLCSHFGFWVSKIHRRDPQDGGASILTAVLKLCPWGTITGHMWESWNPAVLRICSCQTNCELTLFHLCQYWFFLESNILHCILSEFVLSDSFSTTVIRRECLHMT